MSTDGGIPTSAQRFPHDNGCVARHRDAHENKAAPPEVSGIPPKNRTAASCAATRRGVRTTRTAAATSAPRRRLKQTSPPYRPTPPSSPLITIRTMTFSSTTATTMTTQPAAPPPPLRTSSASTLRTSRRPPCRARPMTCPTSGTVHDTRCPRRARQHQPPQLPAHSRHQRRRPSRGSATPTTSAPTSPAHPTNGAPPATRLHPRLPQPLRRPWERTPRASTQLQPHRAQTVTSTPPTRTARASQRAAVATRNNGRALRLRRPLRRNSRADHARRRAPRVYAHRVAAVGQLVSRRAASLSAGAASRASKQTAKSTHRAADARTLPERHTSASQHRGAHAPRTAQLSSAPSPDVTALLT